MGINMVESVSGGKTVAVGFMALIHRMIIIPYQIALLWSKNELSFLT